MSAFIVGQQTMANIVNSLFYDHKFNEWYRILKEHGYTTAKDFDRLYQELYMMNRKAVIDRYEEKEGSDYIELPDEVNWDSGRCSKIQALKSMQCLRYQCSEGDVPESKLYKFLDEIITDWMSYIIGEMPEYEQAVWV
jgi:hypothetical protein